MSDRRSDNRGQFAIPVFLRFFSMPETQTKRETEGFCVSGPAGTYHRISCSISATVSCMRPSLEERLVASRDSIFRSR